VHHTVATLIVFSCKSLRLSSTRWRQSLVQRPDGESKPRPPDGRGAVHGGWAFPGGHDRGSPTPSSCDRGREGEDGAGRKGVDGRCGGPRGVGGERGGRQGGEGEVTGDGWDGGRAGVRRRRWATEVGRRGWREVVVVVVVVGLGVVGV